MTPHETVITRDLRICGNCVLWLHQQREQQMATKTRPSHEPAICKIKPGDQHFNGSMARHCGQWVAKFTCPDCGRQMRMANNYLGDGKLVCTGERFLRPHEQTLGKMGREKFSALLRRY